MTRVAIPIDSNASCNRKRVDHRCEHPHVVCGGFLNQCVTARELGTTKDIPAADDDGDLATALVCLLNLSGDVGHLTAADSPATGVGKTFSAQLEHDPMVTQVRC